MVHVLNLVHDATLQERTTRLQGDSGHDSQAPESGQLKPGDLVDSERELAKIQCVSLMTARHALSGLEREGIVIRRRGASTFVAPPKIHFNKLMSYTEQMSMRGLTVSSKLLSRNVLDSEPELAARLALPAGGRILKFERLRLGGNEPFAIETCYLSADEFADLTRAQLDRVSLFSILERDYGLEILHADEEVDVTTADPVTARVLGVVVCCWVLLVVYLCFAFARRSIRTRARSLCTCSVFTDGTATLFLSGDSVSSSSFPSWKGETHGLSNLTSRLLESSWRGRDNNAPAFRWRAGRRRISVR